MESNNIGPAMEKAEVSWPCKQKGNDEKAIGEDC